MITLVSILILIILGILTILQILLIFGAPLGRFAWGGSHAILPNRLRVGSAIAIVIYGVIGSFVASKAGFIAIITDASIVKIGLWVFFAYCVVGVAMNGISRSKAERYTMTPLCIILALCTWVLATA